MDDDDENDCGHEAGRNYSIPHQESNPFLQKNTPFIKETLFLILLPISLPSL